jgi:trimeric autotransporter adhesin
LSCEHREEKQSQTISRKFADVRRGGRRFKEKIKTGEQTMKTITKIAYVPIVGLGLACFGLAPIAQAVIPPPDGGYPGGNTAEGQAALLSLTTGGFNTAVGFLSLRSDTTGQLNTAVGAGALLANTGNENSATGAGALLSNAGGIKNTANGTFALLFNTTGGSNTAIGHSALLDNTGGSGNTALGFNALYHNVDGIGNVGSGGNALYINSNGNFNTATGLSALYNNDTGHDNTATGYSALAANTDGNSNTAIGDSALYNMAHGSFNVAVGQDAGFTLTVGDGNVYIGAGMNGTTAEANHTYIRNIKDTSVSGLNSDSVTINLNTGLLGHATSSRRYKEDIKPMDNASEALYRLKPVSYRYKKEIDSTRSPAFGLIAEEVADVNPNLVARNTAGQPETVHYEQVNAMLLNEFLKEHKRVQEQQAHISELDTRAARQDATIAVLKAQLKEQAAKIEKVSAYVEVNRPSPQVVANE